MISEYVKDDNNKKIGFMVAAKINNEVVIGYSKYNQTLEKERFSKEKARNIALDRLKKKENCNRYYIPFKMIEPIEKFTKRCKRYFKSYPINI